MTLTRDGAIAQTKTLLEYRAGELKVLDKVHAYVRGKQTGPVSPQGQPLEIRKLAEMSRVNVLGLVVSAVAQSLYVDGYRKEREAENAEAWGIWQANKMDARQSAIHRAALTYGVAYATVLPGDPVPVIKGYSPRQLTAMYGDDEDWPLMALAVERRQGLTMYRLIDEEQVHFIDGGKDGTRFDYLESRVHGRGVVPVVRYRNVHDLEDCEGEVEPLIPIQDQIDLTTFELLVAQHFGSFRQRYVVGWIAPDEAAKVKASVAKLWTFEDAPDDIKVGEFEQTDLKGHLESREASLRQAASLSQTPAHELTGALVNLSAEALMAAEASQRRKVTERQQSFGEAHEQLLALAGATAGSGVDVGAQVRWRDTESRALAAVVDALGKIASQLQVPVQELWERIPGVTQQDIDRWKAAFAQSDPMGSLSALLERQVGGEAGVGERDSSVKEKAEALGMLVRAGADVVWAARVVGLEGFELRGAAATLGGAVGAEVVAALEGAS